MVSSINMRVFKAILVIAIICLTFTDAIPSPFLRLEHRTIDEDSPSLTLDNSDVLEVTPASKQDTYDQRQNGTENYRIHVKGLVVLVAPIESLLFSGGNFGSGNDVLDALGGLSTEKPKPKPDDSKPIASVTETSNENIKPGVAEKKLLHKPHLRFVNLLAPLLKKVSMH